MGSTWVLATSGGDRNKLNVIPNFTSSKLVLQVCEFFFCGLGSVFLVKVACYLLSIVTKMRPAGVAILATVDSGPSCLGRVFKVSKLRWMKPPRVAILVTAVMLETQNVRSISKLSTVTGVGPLPSSCLSSFLDLHILPTW